MNRFDAPPFDLVDLVQENKGGKTMTNRVSSGGSILQEKKEQKEKQEQPRMKRRLVSVERDPFWYQKDTEELKDVTSEDHNERLGITKIRVYEPSQKQIEKLRVVAVVTLETVIGTIRNINVRESKDGKSIFVTTPSRNTARPEEEPNWINDIDLSRPVQAQILRYVETLLVPVEEIQ